MNGSSLVSGTLVISVHATPLVLVVHLAMRRYFGQRHLQRSRYYLRFCRLKYLATHSYLGTRQ